jgi:hypothetical protein
VSTFDYSELVTVAQDLIAEFGRSVAIVKLDRSTVDDGTKPWRGTATPRETPTTSITTSAVFVPLAGVRDLGFDAATTEELKKYSEVCIVAHDATDFDEFDEIQDGAQTYRIGTIKKLQPGDQILLWAFGVSQL